MGLDIQVLEYGQGSWSRSYSGFMLTRTAIAKAAGIVLRDMEGFGGTMPWNQVTAQGLVPLLNHSDCEGRMARYECEMVADALAPLIDSIDAEERPCVDHLLNIMRAGAAGAGVEFH